ncbi:hypothetical protein L1987_35511 [Smallanthus sonchifolius]|uniref:Uncharacterized protein n=1 Tax=Smallanthus sonchifolius TaxID=185202 RepID=A0ACB9HYA6_9ASTR|nr:hypothetical protein L1987_35511 [Smallanthus sonchifolius]
MKDHPTFSSLEFTTFPQTGRLCGLYRRSAAIFSDSASLSPNGPVADDALEKVHALLAHVFHTCLQSFVLWS